MKPVHENITDFVRSRPQDLNYAELGPLGRDKKVLSIWNSVIRPSWLWQKASYLLHVEFAEKEKNKWTLD